MTPTILQIFQDVDLRRGEQKLAEVFSEKTRQVRRKFQTGEVVVFVNRKRNKLRIIAKKGMMSESLGKGQTYDLTLRRDELLKSIGKFFGLEFSVKKSAFDSLQKSLKKKGVK